jgi:integrase
LWKNIDLKELSFTIEDTKNHANHTLPITPFLYEILVEQMNIKKNDFVFPSFDGNGPIIEPRKIMNKISESCGLSWTLHDLRRTFITVAESLDVPAYALKRLLNHKTNNSDVTGGYIVIDVERLRGPMNTISNYFIKMAQNEK